MIIHCFNSKMAGHFRPWGPASLPSLVVYVCRRWRQTARQLADRHKDRARADSPEKQGIRMLVSASESDNGGMWSLRSRRFRRFTQLLFIDNADYRRGVSTLDQLQQFRPSSAWPNCSMMSACFVCTDPHKRQFTRSLNQQ